MDINSCLTNLINSFVLYSCPNQTLLHGFFVRKDLMSTDSHMIICRKGYLDLFKYFYNKRHHDSYYYISTTLGHNDIRNWLTSIKRPTPSFIAYKLLKDRDITFWGWENYMSSRNHAIAICYSNGDVWMATYFLYKGVTNLTVSLQMIAALNKTEMILPIKEAAITYNLPVDTNGAFTIASNDNNYDFLRELNKHFPRL